MSSVYREILSCRHDITEWLIHFTRRRNGASPLDSLKKYLAEGIIRPSYAQRSGCPTIYGPYPAVCFTEQPLYAFAQSVVVRNKNEGVNKYRAISPYGVLIHKNDLFALGGLPVIYGVHDHVERGEKTNGKRMIDTRELPLDQQYRYSAFNPNAPDNQHRDWSHEREWRWAFRSDDPLAEHQGFPIGGAMSSDRGHAKRRCHVVVPSRKEAGAIRQHIASLQLVDVEDENWYRAEWYKRLAKIKIIVLKDVVNRVKTHGPKSPEQKNGD